MLLQKFFMDIDQAIEYVYDNNVIIVLDLNAKKSKVVF